MRWTLRWDVAASSVFNVERRTSAVEVVVIGNSKDVEGLCTCQVLQLSRQKVTQLTKLVVTDATG